MRILRQLDLTWAPVLLIVGCSQPADSGQPSPASDPAAPADTSSEHENSPQAEPGSTEDRALVGSTPTRGEDVATSEPGELFTVQQQRPVTVGTRRRLTLMTHAKRTSRVSLGQTPIRESNEEVRLILQGIERVRRTNRRGQPTELEIVVEQCLLQKQDQPESVLVAPGATLRVAGTDPTRVQLVGGTLSEEAQQALDSALSLSSSENQPALSDTPRPVGTPWVIDAPEYLDAFNSDPGVNIDPEHFESTAEIVRVTGEAEDRAMELRLAFHSNQVSFSALPEAFVPTTTAVVGRIFTVLPVDVRAPERRREVRFRLKLMGTMPLPDGISTAVLTTLENTSSRSYSPLGDSGDD